MNSFARTKVLLKDSFDKLKNSTVAIVGLGGVGGIAAESIVRTGVGRVILIDFDRIDETNINRQIIANQINLNRLKVQEFEQRFITINPYISILPLNLEMTVDNTHILDKFEIDFLIDSFDMLQSKWALIKYCLNRSLPFISVLGMGNRYQPELVKCTTLDSTLNDPVAKVLRKKCNVDKVNSRKIKVIASSELPVINPGVSKPGSMMFVPATAGLLAGNEAVKWLIKNK